MAVLVEGIDVVVRVDAILKRFPGGWDGFERIVPNQTLCADDEIVRVGFMTPQDVESFIRELQASGLEFLRDGKSIDIAVADQMRGLTTRCEWLEFGHVELDGDGHRVAACRLTGSVRGEVVTPPGWRFEDSLSSTFAFVPNESVKTSMKFLRHEDGLDVYHDSVTDREMYVGRAEGRPSRNWIRAAVVRLKRALGKLSGPLH